jgi:hypothetical protein
MSNSLQKNWGPKADQFPKSSNLKYFKSRHFEKGQTLGKSPTFLDSDRLGYRTTLSSRSLRYAQAVFFLDGKGSAMELVIELYVCTDWGQLFKKLVKTILL